MKWVVRPFGMLALFCSFYKMFIFCVIKSKFTGHVSKALYYIIVIVNLRPAPASHGYNAGTKVILYCIMCMLYTF
jgi:cytochrome b subunit of formate dehydrogenase